jgi:signal transduction histidine kinase
MFERKSYYIIAIATFSLLITFLHFLVFEQLAPHVVLEELYYIPLLFGALMFGLKGAILTYLIVSVAYVPFFYGGWAAGVLGIVDRVLHLLFSGFFSFLAGFFVERLKRQQKETERNRYLANLGLVAETIVHDLKNPLITILGFAKQIQERKGNINTAIEAITESAQNMQKL